MPLEINFNIEGNATYSTVVESWMEERRLLGCVQPYTATKAYEKACLFSPWLGNVQIARIEPSAITHALIELGQKGGKSGEGLSSSTLRAAHLAATQAIDWAICNGIATDNPF